MRQRMAGTVLREYVEQAGRMAEGTIDFTAQPGVHVGSPMYDAK